MSTTSVPTPVANPVVRLGGNRSARDRLAGRPATDELIDRFGRVARDLRVSLTDLCNLRCQYCMPEEGIDPAPRADILTDGEVIRLIRIAVEHLGIEKIRFTGGEPLLRKGLEQIIRASSFLRTPDGRRPELALTTNGLGLTHRAHKLAEAGLDRVNLSLDTADPLTYHILTRRDRFHDAVAGARAAVDAGLTPVKVNTVLMPGVNANQALDVALHALRAGYHLRFIEYMPLGPRDSWKREEMVTAEDILAQLTPTLVMHERPGRGSSPAQVWDVEAGVGPDGQPFPAGDIGIIASVTRPFCGDCDRTRLTADGKIRSCLFSHTEFDVRELVRSNASDREIGDLWRLAMWEKKAGHGIDDPSFVQPERPMSAIGG